MKSVPYSDQYPDAAAASYKRFRSEDPEVRDEANRPQKVLQVKKKVAKVERDKVREKQELRRISENLNKQKQLKELIDERKRQIQQLEQQRKLMEEEQVRSFELAKFKEQQEKQRLERKKQQQRENSKAAKERGSVAFQRMLQEKQIAEAKEREAAYRRKVTLDAERQERNKAIQRQKYIEATRPQQEPKLEFDDFYKPLGRQAYNRNIDYSKTFLHNPVLVKHSLSQQGLKQTGKWKYYLALQRAAEVQEQSRRAKQQKESSLQRMKQISQERGRQAMRKIANEKMQEQVVKQSAEAIKNYNLYKLEQGQRDQELGLKAGTMAQMQVNKKIRSERQFEQMFFKDKKLQWITQPAARYQILQNRSQQGGGSVITDSQVRSRKSLEESIMPNESRSKYSFAEDNQIIDESFQTKEMPKEIIQKPLELAAKKSPEDLKEQMNFANTMLKQVQRKSKVSEADRQHIPRSPERFPENYEEVKPERQAQTMKSSSKFKQQSMKPQLKDVSPDRDQIKQFIRQNEQYLKNMQKNRRVIFKDNSQEHSRNSQNLHKQTTKTGAQKVKAPVDEMVYRLTNSQVARRANQQKLSNVCQNRQHEDLEYSNDSQNQYA